MIKFRVTFDCGVFFVYGESKPAVRKIAKAAAATFGVELLQILRADSKRA